MTKIAKSSGILIVVLIIISLFMTPILQVTAGGTTEEEIPNYPSMRPDNETLKKWVQAYEEAPKAPMASVESAPQGSLSLLSHLDYIPAQHNQASCGNCWAWAGAGAMGIALDVESGIYDRLSVQYINSCQSSVLGKACCGGGWLDDVTDFYSTPGYQQAIPWSNPNAHWQDGDVSCDTSCGSIATSPNYPIDNIQEVTIPTHGVGQAQAIANIKSALNNNEAVWVGFFVATDADWNAWGTFWSTQPESAIWDPDYSCEHWESYTDEASGHAVLIVGYNDDDPAHPYWEVVNSWGTTASRPNGIFRLDMNMNYDCAWYDLAGEHWYSFYFEKLDIDFTVNPPTPNIWVAPPKIDVTLPPKTIWDGNLIIENNGDSALTYSIMDLETTGGPYFEWVAMEPNPLPANGEGLLMARVHDPDGLADILYVKAFVTQDPSDYAYMRDDGIAPDEVAGDGIYTHPISGYTGYGEEHGLLFEAKDMADNIGHSSLTVHVDIPEVTGGSIPAFSLGGEEAAEMIIDLPGELGREASPSDGEGNSRTSSSMGVAIQTESNSVKAEPLGSPAIALIQTGASISDSVGRALDELGYSYDFYATADFSGINFSLYDVVIVGADGGAIDEDPDVIALHDFVAGGGKLIFIGGTYYTSFAQGVDKYLLDIDTENYVWSIVSGDPDMGIVNPAHPLAAGLSDYSFNTDEATYYMLRIQETAISGAAKNGDGEWSLVAKEVGSGVLIWFINSPAHTHWPNPSDYSVLKQVVKNALEWADCPWLDEKPKSGEISPLSTHEIAVKIDTTGLALGDYSAEIWIASNDPDENPTIVPVQLTVKPIIERGHVLFDSAHDNHYNLNDYRDFVEIIQAEGYGVDELITGPITSDMLEKYCVLMLSDPLIPYTADERSAILDFVKLGGGLFVLGDNRNIFNVNTNLNQVVNAVGIDLNTDMIHDNTNYHNQSSWPFMHQFSSHPVTDGLGHVWYIAGCSIDVEDPAFELAWGDDDSFVTLSSAPGSGLSGTTAAPESVEVEFDSPIVNGAVSEQPVEVNGVVHGTGTIPYPLGANVMDFDDTAQPCDFADTIALTNEYAAQGVLFQGPGGNDGGAILNECSGFAVTGHSSPNFLAFNTEAFLSDGGIPQYPETISFSDPVSYVQINAGAGYSAGTVTMYAYDSGGFVGTDTITLGPAMQTLTVTHTGIVRVVITSTSTEFVLDDLAFTTEPQNPIAIAASEYGSGRVVAIGDSNIINSGDADTDGTLDIYQYDNARLAINTIKWLCQGLVEQPDLVVEDIYSSPEHLVAGDEIEVWARVCNNGPVPVTDKYGIQFYLDGSPIGGYMGQDPLNSGECFDLRDIVWWPKDCEPHSVRVVADVDNNIDESNEENNMRMELWSATTYPSIEVNKLVWDSELGEWVDEVNAEIGDTVRFQCTIHNDGLCYPLTEIVATDILSKSLEYANKATVNGEPWEPTMTGPNEFAWDFKDLLLEPSNRIVIEFDARVVACDYDINLQMVDAWCPETEAPVHDEDTAAVNCIRGLCGDVNDDGSVDMTDVMLLWWDEAEYPKPGDWTISNPWAADVNCDGDIDMTDVMLLWWDEAEYPKPGDWVIKCCD